ncbi:MAG: sigma-70 family RNA polymerase sigma factor [Planctomycetota bacterium]|nr:sigma-70 family RNA polymerase sigma factor [Planctomycetota bacterium]
MEPLPNESKFISEHGAFVRRLAAALTRCEADADDLEQGTWVEALNRPPGEWTSPRGWLSRVMRRKVGKGRRSDERRSLREKTVARKERIESDLDLSLVLGELSGALQALDPDLRRVVIARHFEGLELAELARREGVGLTTVKARLKRAHSELRHSLDRSEGGRERWMLALVPLGHAPVPVPPIPAAHSPLTISTTLATGVLALSTFKAVTALILVGALLFGITQLGGPSEAGSQAGLVGMESEAERSVEVVEPHLTQERTQVVNAPEDSKENQAIEAVPFANVHVVVTDLFGMPARGVSVFAAPVELPLNRVGSTDREGKFAVEWLPKGQKPLVIGVEGKGKWLGGLRRFSLAPGAHQEFRLAIHPELLPSHQASIGSWRVSGAIATMHGVESGLVGAWATEALNLPQARTVKRSPRRDRKIHPYPRQDEVTHGALFSAFGGEDRWERELSFVTDRVLFLESRIAYTPTGPEGKLSGSVRDNLGQPVAFTRVRAVGDQTLEGEVPIPMPVVEDAYTDIKGEYSMDLAAGEYSVRTEAKASEASASKVRVEEGGEATWHGFVDPGISLVGTIDFQKSPDGDLQESEEPETPVLMVEAVHAQPGKLWVGVTLSQEDGRFLLPRCASTFLKVQFSQLEDGRILHSEERALTGQLDWRIALDAADRTTVTYSPMDGEGEGPGVAELRIWDAAMERGWTQNVGGRLGEPAAVSLAPGVCFLELASAGAFASEPMRVEVLKGEPMDLGPIGLGPAAWLQTSEAPAGHEWVVVSEGAEQPRFVAYSGQGRPTEEGLQPRVAVPPGIYRIQQWVSGTEEEEGTTLELGTIELGPQEVHILTSPIQEE